MRRTIRRSTVALAAVVGLCGVGVAAAVPALAFSVSGSATVTPGHPVLLVAGGVGQAVSNVAASFADSGASHVWSAGDTITVQLWDATTGSALSNTTVNAFEGASFSTLPSVAATNSVDSTYYGVALAKGATSSVNDEFILTFKKDAPEDANTTKFTFSGLKLTLGSRIPAGHHIQLKMTASNGTPFTGAASTAVADVGVIPATTVSTTSVATGAPSAASVPLGSITVRDFTGGAVQAGDEIDLTLMGGFFSIAGSMGGTIPVGTVPTITTVTSTSDSLKLTAAKTSVVGDTLTLSGAKVTLPASAREVYLVVKDKTTSTILGAVGVATVVKQTRVGGTDRYATASQLFDLDFSGASSVVLTSGTNYPDALSAVYLARQLSTGVLTTDPNNLPAATKSELVAHGITTVYIIGGTSAVSAGVATQIAGLHVGNNSSASLLNVIRIAGADRYATNKMVDTYRTATSKTAIVATGDNFADALAVGPAIYKTGDPLILTTGTSLTASAQATISALGITHAVIVGGTSAVSAGVETALGAAGVTVDYRIAGAERTQTAASIAAWETDGLAGHDIYPAIGSLGFTGTSVINVARGDSFADALAAGAVAGADQSVIVLTSDPLTLGAGIPQYFAGRAGTTATIRALGLTAALSATTVTQAAASLTQPLAL